MPAAHRQPGVGAMLAGGAVQHVGPRPATWKLALAFAIVYIGYGLNFLAVKVGVETLPAFLFAGSHVIVAGVVLGCWRFGRRGPFPFSRAGLLRAAVAAFFLFVGGVGLVTEGEKLGVASGVAAIIKASVPLWVAFLEALRPGGERPRGLGFVGLLAGAAGVLWLVIPRFGPHAGTSTEPLGIGLLVLSAFLFALGTIFVRHHPPSGDAFANSSAMMVIGGVYLAVLGLALGEAREVSASDFTAPAAAAFGFLLIVHSLGAFSAMNWLLAHIPASVVTTKFYVSPAVAVVAGWIVLGERVGPATVGALSCILGGVALTMWAEAGRKAEPELKPDDADELQE